MKIKFQAPGGFNAEMYGATLNRSFLVKLRERTQEKVIFQL
jgi:hypothetical protein